MLDELGVGTDDLADAGRDRRRDRRSRTTASTPATTPTRCTGSGWRWSRWSGCSRCSAPGSSASRARCTCSGGRSTWPHPVLGADGAAAPGRRAELRAARDVGGVLARGEQLRLLAGRAGRGGRVLRLRLPGTARLPRRAGHAGGRPVGRRPRRVRPALRARPHRARIPTRCCSSSCRPPTRRRRRQPAGTAPHSNAPTEAPHHG